MLIPVYFKRINLIVPVVRIEFISLNPNLTGQNKTHNTYYLVYYDFTWRMGCF